MKHKLTQREPVRCKAYPTSYKMQEIVDKEIDDLLKLGVIGHSEAPYDSPLVLVKKPIGLIVMVRVWWLKQLKYYGVKRGLWLC